MVWFFNNKNGLTRKIRTIWLKYRIHRPSITSSLGSINSLNFVFFCSRFKTSYQKFCNWIYISYTFCIIGNAFNLEEILDGRESKWKRFQIGNMWTTSFCFTNFFFFLNLKRQNLTKYIINNLWLIWFT